MSIPTQIAGALHRYFIKNNNTLPDRIFLYRDGVGDGQIPYVRDQEVSSTSGVLLSFISYSLLSS